MPQVSATVTPELVEELKKIAEKEKRTISSTVEILLERAIKEKNRIVVLLHLYCLVINFYTNPGL